MATINADYQFELRLISYLNPGGYDQTGTTCCEPEAQIGSFCFSACDTEFSIHLENGQLQTLHQAMVVGEFTDMDSITFPRCGPIINEMENPVVFTFSASTFNITRVCK